MKKCPNCMVELDADDHRHLNGCLLGALLTVLTDRGHEPSSLDATKVDADVLWDRFGAPAADFVAEQIGVGRYP